MLEQLGCRLDAIPIPPSLFGETRSSTPTPTAPSSSPRTLISVNGNVVVLPGKHLRSSNMSFTTSSSASDGPFLAHPDVPLIRQTLFAISSIPVLCEDFPPEFYAPTSLIAIQNIRVIAEIRSALSASPPRLRDALKIFLENRGSSSLSLLSSSASAPPSPHPPSISSSSLTVKPFFNRSAYRQLALLSGVTAGKIQSFGEEFERELFFVDPVARLNLRDYDHPLASKRNLEIVASCASVFCQVVSRPSCHTGGITSSSLAFAADFGRDFNYPLLFALHETLSGRRKPMTTLVLPGASPAAGGGLPSPASSRHSAAHSACIDIN